MFAEVATVLPKACLDVGSTVTCACLRHWFNNGLHRATAMRLA